MSGNISQSEAGFIPIRLYIDEDAMARAVVNGLRARGIDVTTVLGARMSEEDDAVQLEHATREGRVLYTFNVGHYCRLQRELLSQDKSHAGIVVVYRQRYSAGEQIRRLSNLISGVSAGEMRNRLHFL